MSHKYPHNGYVYSSVTTIISDCTDKSQALMGWSAREVCNWIRQNCDHVNGEHTDFWEVTQNDLKNAQHNYRDVSQDALDVGSAVHEAIEYYLKTNKEPILTNDKVIAGYVAFLEWKDKHQLLPLALEETVYGNYWGGMLDYRGLFDEKEYVIDWKTSKAHYPEMRYQIAAYRSANPNVVGSGVLRLDKETGMPDWKDHSKTYEKDLQVFNNMVELYYSRHPLLAKKAGWEGK